MSAEFVDTNVLVYAYDPTTPDKHEQARTLVTRLWESGDGVLSIQVLQEFFWTITRKVPRPISPSQAVDLIEEFATWNVFEPAAEDVIQAARLSVRRRISFWDAMIVQSAIASGAELLWTEDLTAGTKFDDLTVRSPFA
jgi:predicted nucleic acid-binding protein